VEIRKEPTVYINVACRGGRLAVHLLACLPREKRVSRDTQFGLCRIRSPVNTVSWLLAPDTETYSFHPPPQWLVP